MTSAALGADGTAAGDGGDTALVWLSSAWFTAVDEAVRDGAVTASCEGPALVLQQHVVGGPDGDVAYSVCLGGEHRGVRPGAHPTPTVTITAAHETAAAVVRGDLTAQAAFLAGHLRVRGDLVALACAQGALQGLDVALARVQARTVVETPS